MPGKTYRRSRLELYLDVLKAIYHGRRAPSRVVYAANLSYDRVIVCINFLIEHNLVERIEGITKKRYTITESGKNVVKYFHEIEIHMGRKKYSDTLQSPTLSIRARAYNQNA
jgi:predicted transcriptional regulator